MIKGSDCLLYRVSTFGIIEFEAVLQAIIQEVPDLGGKQGVISCHCNELDWLFASSVVESGGDLRVSHEQYDM